MTTQSNKTSNPGTRLIKETPEGTYYRLNDGLRVFIPNKETREERQ